MKLFHDREDFRFFLRTLKRYMIEYEFKLLSTCLMSNHIHLLIIDKGIQLPVIMDAVESVYACYYIDKYNYTGRVFESRFKSNLLKSKRILLILIRYVNRNPIVARITDSIFNYLWSILTPDRDEFNLIDFKYVNSVFKEECKIGYLEYLNSAEDDLWIDPIEVQRMENIDALDVYNNIADRMSINLENIMIPVYNEKNSSFISACIYHGITMKQIMKFSGLTRYKIEKLKDINKKSQ